MSWKVVQMKAFLSERKGRYKPNDTAIKGLKRIEKIDFSGNIFLSDKPSKTDMILIKQGDLVISGINVEKGAMSIYKGQEDVIATIHYSSYDYNTEKIDIDFLRHFLKSPEFIEALKEQVPGGIKTEIKPKHILPLKVCIPTNIEEQGEVVAFLDQQNITLETQSTELTHQLDLVKQLRQAFLREAMQGKLVPQDPNDEPASVLLEKIKAEKQRLIKEEKIKKQKALPPITEDEIPFGIPENWVWCRLGELIYDTEGGKSPNCQNVPAEGDQWGVIKTTAVQEMIFLENENKILPKHYVVNPRHIVENGDVLITRAGPKNRVGIVCCIEDLSLNLILSDKTIRILHNKELVNSKFMALALNSPLIKPIIESKMTGMADSQVNISQDNMKRFLIPFPPLSEQQHIVAKLDELMAFCDGLEASIKESQQQNELLLQQVLKEALEPKDVELV
jgi:type I restriction enzyme S subunit